MVQLEEEDIGEGLYLGGRGADSISEADCSLRLFNKEKASVV